MGAKAILQRYCARTLNIDSDSTRRREQLARAALVSRLKVTDAELDELAGIEPKKPVPAQKPRKRGKKGRSSETGDSTG